MNQPTIYDDILGELVWNSEDECWSSQAEISSGHLINITIDPEEAETGAVILIARQYFSKLQQEEMQVRQQIAEEMLEQCHDWNDGEGIDHESFIQQIALEEIVVYASGEVQLWYNDGDLFAGHAIMVNISAEGKYQRASLVG